MKVWLPSFRVDHPLPTFPLWETHPEEKQSIVRTQIGLHQERAATARELARTSRYRAADKDGWVSDHATREYYANHVEGSWWMADMQRWERKAEDIAGDVERLERHIDQLLERGNSDPRLIVELTGTTLAVTEEANVLAQQIEYAQSAAHKASMFHSRGHPHRGLKGLYSQFGDRYEHDAEWRCQRAEYLEGLAVS